jgi:membrane-bound lytic murein transglycosylase D
LFRYHALWTLISITWLSLAGCSSTRDQVRVDTDIATEEKQLQSVVVDSLPAAEVNDLLSTGETVFEEPVEVNSEWSIKDRALAFKPELQSIQVEYDQAVHFLAIGDLLSAQERLDMTNLTLTEAMADSQLARGSLTRLYLSSLQTRLDRLQEVLDEESLMHFSAPLEVANDSLVALWYGGLPDEPSRPLELVINDRVQKWLDYFNGKGRKNFQRWLNRGEAFRPLIDRALAEHNLPRELYYLGMIESGFNTRARSRAGAVGPWQFIRGTARRYGLIIDYWVDERNDIVRSTEAACQYLSHLHGIFQDWNLAMAGYNSGEFRVQSAARRAGSRDFWNLKLPRETKDYVPKMMAAALIGQDPGKYGFEVKAASTFEYEELRAKQAVDLSLLAKKGKFKKSKIEDMNPHLLRWCTPPDHPGGYTVHVPVGKKRVLETALGQLSRDEQVTFAKHRIRKGETLYEIARGYGTTVKAIMRRNGIKNPRRLRPGKTLVIPTNPSRSFRQQPSNGVIASAEKVLPPLSVPRNSAKGFYTVRKGDNLSIIARRLSCSVSRLQRWNDLGRSTRIYPNQVLQYLYSSPGAPGSGNVSGPVAEGTRERHIHVVAKGESLYSISKRYRTSVNAILGWNSKLTKKTTIYPGDKLVLFLKG